MNTPGPWKAVKGDTNVVCDGAWGDVQEAGDDYAIATIWADTDELESDAEANARLIAAAPDLLAALKEYLEWGAMTGSDRDLFNEKFTSAIAKAEGREP
jgi:hypothetical protein